MSKNIFPLYGGCAVITTYRCNAHCKMCHRHQHQSKQSEEFKPELILKLPHMYAINITGGEPFLRDDILEIVKFAHQRAHVVTISTNGTLTDRILEVMTAYPNTGIRISIEGYGALNNEIRGIENGFEKAETTLRNLKRLGCKNIGISTTISDKNVKSVFSLYEFCQENGYQFATGAVHNSFFFESTNEEIEHSSEVRNTLLELSNRMRHEGTLKDKYRAIFNEELANYVIGEPICFPCQAANGFFALDPYGNILSCVGSEKARVMGNLIESDFATVWNSKQANNVRKECGQCKRNCCMSGHVGVEMRKEAIQLLPEALLGRRRT